MRDIPTTINASLSTAENETCIPKVCDTYRRKLSDGIIDISYQNHP